MHYSENPLDQCLFCVILATRSLSMLKHAQSNILCESTKSSTLEKYEVIMLELC